MGTAIIIILGVLLVGGAVTLTIVGLRRPQAEEQDRELLARLEEFNAAGEEVDLRKLELSQPFTQRVIYPMARKLGEIAIRFTPQKMLQSISRKLELAGSPAGLDATMILAAQFIVAAVFAGIVILVFSVGSTVWPITRIILLTIGIAAVGFYFPQLYLTSKVGRRQKEIRKAMPDALDLLTICVEAGLGFDAALAKVSEKWQTELSLAFARCIREIQLGKTRRESLRDMADRIGIPEMTSFVAAVIQSEQLGVSMSKVLRIQADQMRVKRRQLAEEEAHKAPIKMLLPMGGCIFPSLMIVLLTPAGIRLVQGFMQ